jgi:hypothetical protein
MENHATKTETHPLVSKSHTIEMCAFVGISPEDYFLHQLEEAYNYLEAFLPNITENEQAKQTFVKSLTQSRVFWAWWLKHWVSRDQIMLSDSFVSFSPTPNRLIIYNEVHDGKDLANSLKLYGKLMNESYIEVVKRIVIEEVKNEQ